MRPWGEQAIGRLSGSESAEKNRTAIQLLNQPETNKVWIRLPWNIEALLSWGGSFPFFIWYPSINRSIGSYNTSLFQNDPGWWRLQFCLALKPGSGLPCATTTCIFLQTETGRIPTQCHMERSINHISSVSIARCQNMRQVGVGQNVTEDLK